MEDSSTKVTYTRSAPNVATYYYSTGLPANGEVLECYEPDWVGTSGTRKLPKRRLSNALLLEIRKSAELRKRLKRIAKAKSFSEVKQMHQVRFARTRFVVKNQEKTCIPSKYGETCIVGPLGLGASSLTRLVGTLNTESWDVSQACKERSAINCLSQLAEPDNLDVGVALGELSETLKFIRRPFPELIKRFTKMTEAFKRKYLVSTRMLSSRDVPPSWIEVFSDTWLNYRYALMPTVSDISGAMVEASVQAEQITSRLRRVVGVATDPQVTVTGQQYTISGPNNTLGTIQGLKEYYIRRCYSLVRYRYKPFMSDAIRLATLGLSPTQAISTAWELVPGSFIVDWGVMIGPWLAAMQPKPFIEYVDSCRTVRERKVVELYGYMYLNTAGNVPVPMCLAERQKMVRVLEAIIPPLTPPLTGRALGIKQQLDTLAIGSGIIKNLCDTIRTIHLKRR